ncbi:MAG: NACHT domain-containing protein [Mycobacteriales bacterium]
MGRRDGTTWVWRWVAGLSGASLPAAVLAVPALRAEPLLAAGVTVLGVAVLLVAGFFASVYGRLRDRWVDDTADLVDRSLRHRLARFTRTYRELVLSLYRDLDVRDLTTQGLALDIRQIYIELPLVGCSALEADAGVLPPRPPAGTAHRDSSGPAPMRSIWQYLGRGRREPVRLVVLGPPGGGKTTLLKRVAVTLAAGGREARAAGVAARLPMLLFLRAHAERIIKDDGVTLADLLSAALANYLVTEPSGWILDHLRAGRFTVMLDGLDEVADEADRAQVAAWVDRQMAAFHRNDFILTSRPLGYRDNQVRATAVVQVRPLNEPQAGDFLRRWYELVSARVHDRDDRYLQSEARQRADTLLEGLAQVPTLRELISNPLLLTMIAHVHYYRGALPGSRTELYEEICEVLLGRRQLAKGLSARPNAGQRLVVLQHLALRMMELQVSDLSPREAAREIRDRLGRIDPALRAEEFLATVQAESGLLVERECGFYSFAHQTFQEYLAAQALHESGHIGVLLDHLGDPWWRETCVLFATMADASPIVDHCLNMHSPPIGVLAVTAECLDQCREVNPALREMFDRQLSAEQQLAGAERQRRLRGIQLCRRARRVERIGPDHYVCTELVTAGDYRCFLEDRAGDRAEDRDGPGGSWSAPSTDPVTGVSSRDALAFAGWLRDTLRDGWRYRLPHPGELDRADSSALRGWPGFGIWTSGDGGTEYVEPAEEPPRPELLPVYLADFAALEEFAVEERSLADLLHRTVPGAAAQRLAEVTAGAGPHAPLMSRLATLLSAERRNPLIRHLSEAILPAAADAHMAPCPDAAALSHAWEWFTRLQAHTRLPRTFDPQFVAFAEALGPPTPCVDLPLALGAVRADMARLRDAVRRHPTGVQRYLRLCQLTDVMDQALTAPGRDAAALRRSARLGALGACFTVARALRTERPDAAGTDGFAVRPGAGTAAPPADLACLFDLLESAGRLARMLAVAESRAARAAAPTESILIVRDLDSDPPPRPRPEPPFADRVRAACRDVACPWATVTPSTCDGVTLELGAPHGAAVTVLSRPAGTLLGHREVEEFLRTADRYHSRRFRTWLLVSDAVPDHEAATMLAENTGPRIWALLSPGDHLRHQLRDIVLRTL